MSTHGHMGPQEVAERLRVSRQRLYVLLRTYSDDFPAPAAQLRNGPVWHSADIDRWAAKHVDRPTGVTRRKN